MSGLALEVQFLPGMKMLCDYQGIDLVKTEVHPNLSAPKLKRLHTAAESLVLAMRYVAIQVRDEEKLDSILRKIAFLDELRLEIKAAASSGEIDSLSQWALELSIVSESSDLEKIHEFLDSLFRGFADACVWLSELESNNGPEGDQRSDLVETYQRLIDFVACGSLAIVSGGASAIDHQAA